MKTIKDARTFDELLDIKYGKLGTHHPEAHGNDTYAQELCASLKKTIMMIRKIYNHLIDGTDSWVPIDAKHIQNDQFEIIENKEYDDLDASELFEFFPGDIVELEQHIFTDGTKGQIAKKLKVCSLLQSSM